MELGKFIKEGAFLVDVREPFEVEENPIEGAVNIPVSTIPYELNKFVGKEKIVVFCRSGNRSNMARMMLQSSGYNNVFDGGSWLNVKSAIQTV